MFDFIDTIPSVYILALAGASLGYLALRARIDRVNASVDRRLSELDRNAAAELYRLATCERRRDIELVQHAYEELKQVVALYEAREARRSTPWESLGIAARNVG